MTRQDFELIAEVVREAAISDRDRWTVALAFDKKLVQISPRYDRARFLAACEADDSYTPARRPESDAQSERPGPSGD